MNLQNNDLLIQLIEYIQINFTYLDELEATIPFATITLVLFLVSLSTTFFDITQKDIWKHYPIIILKNLIKLIGIICFISGYYSVTTFVLTIWFVFDKFLDYRTTNICRLYTEKIESCKNCDNDCKNRRNESY